MSIHHTLDQCVILTKFPTVKRLATILYTFVSDISPHALSCGTDKELNFIYTASNLSPSPQIILDNLNGKYLQCRQKWALTCASNHSVAARTLQSTNHIAERARIQNRLKKYNIRRGRGSSWLGLTTKLVNWGTPSHQSSTYCHLH